MEDIKGPQVPVDQISARPIEYAEQVSAPPAMKARQINYADPIQGPPSFGGRPTQYADQMYAPPPRQTQYADHQMRYAPPVRQPQYADQWQAAPSPPMKVKQMQDEIDAHSVDSNLTEVTSKSYKNPQFDGRDMFFDCDD
jgi:hypothetical protein